MLNTKNYEAWFRKNFREFEEEPFLFIAEEKHTTYHHLCNSIEDLLQVAIYTVNRRFDEGWYNPLAKKDLDFVSSIIDGKNGWLAVCFLSNRATYEYESVEWKTFEKVEE